MNLPNLDKMFPKEEGKVFSTCIRCGDEIMEGYEFVASDSYDYCSIECFVTQACEDGVIKQGVAGE